MEKENINLESVNKLLGTKRYTRSVADNYVFRRVLTGRIEGKYETIVNTYYNMFSFNWDDEKNIRIKQNPMYNLTPASYWFYINSMYFPYCSNEFKDKFEIVHEMFNKILEKLVNSKGLIKKSSFPLSKRNIIIDLASIIRNEIIVECEGGYRFENNLFKKINIDTIISRLNDMHLEISNFNKSKFEDLKNNFNNKFTYECCDEFNEYDSNDILNDMSYKSFTLKKFKEYILRRHEEKSSNVITCRAEEEFLNNPDDIVCLVCNDGDYEDNNLIVYCSICQMTVHQNCYGIVDIPKDDWNCYSCICYGIYQSKEIECILCPVRGGAMKPSLLKKNSHFYNTIINLRRNNEDNLIKFDMDIINYNNEVQNEILMKEEEVKKIKLDKFFIKIILNNLNKQDRNEVNPNIKNFIVETNDSINETNKQSIITHKRGRKKKKKINKHLESNKNKINELPISLKNFLENAWVHLSCACWIPEVEIVDFDRKDEIKNIELIEKSRFLEKCSICNKSGYGPTIKCENSKCYSKFHVECARINKYQLEFMNNPTGDFKYYIFCNYHRPHRLIKNVELKRQRDIDDILSYSENLDKIYETLRKQCKMEFNVYNPKKGYKNGNSIENKKINKQKSRKEIIKKVREIIIQLSNLKLTYRKSNDEYILQKSSNKKINITYYDTLSPKTFPWYTIKINKLSPYESFCLYKEIVPNEQFFMQKILKKKYKLIKLKKDIIPFNISEAKDSYCYCKNYKNGDFLVACSNFDEEFNKCKSIGWFHPYCIDDLKNLSQEELDSPDVNFICFKCKEITDQII